LTATFEEEPLEAYLWELSDVPSPWNTFWTDTAREGGGLDIDDAVVGQFWTKYRRLHFELFPDCDSEEAYDCEGLNCVPAQSTIGQAAAASRTAISLGILLIAVVPSTLTPSKIDAYKWHW